MAKGDRGCRLREEMKVTTAHSDVGLGIFFIGLGALALCFVPWITNPGLGHNSDPGPRLFPAALAIVLVLGGAAFTVRGVVGKPHVPATYGGRRLDAVVLLGAIGVYIAAMPLLGFALSTGLFAAGAMLWLKVRARVAIPVTLVLLLAVYLLFAKLFKVQLPAGTLLSVAL